MERYDCTYNHKEVQNRNNFTIYMDHYCDILILNQKNASERFKSDDHKEEGPAERKFMRLK